MAKTVIPVKAKQDAAGAAKAPVAVPNTTNKPNPARNRTMAAHARGYFRHKMPK